MNRFLVQDRFGGSRGAAAEPCPRASRCRRSTLDLHSPTQPRADARVMAPPPASVMGGTRPDPCCAEQMAATAAQLASPHDAVDRDARAERGCRQRTTWPARRVAVYDAAAACGINAPPRCCHGPVAERRSSAAARLSHHLACARGGSTARPPTGLLSLSPSARFRLSTTRSSRATPTR